MMTIGKWKRSIAFGRPGVKRASVGPLHCGARCLPGSRGGAMDWSNATWWWVATGVLVAAELATGTFYLLMMAIGTAAAALSAHAGAGFTGQLVAAALIGGGA